MDTKKYDYTYDFLSDNGFFNDSDRIESAENHQLETVDKRENLLQRMSEFEDDILTPLYSFVCAFAFVCMFASLMILETPFADIFGGTDNTKKAGILFLIIGVMSLLGWIKNGVGLSTARIIYLSRKKLMYGRTAYTLDFNCKVVPVKIIDLSWSEDKALLICRFKNVAKEYDDWRGREFSSEEVFPTPQAATSAAADVRLKRRAALYPILGDKTEIFLNSSMLNEYADLFYLNYKIKSCYTGDSNDISFRDFLMNKESLSAFCEFVDRQKKKEKKEADRLKSKEIAEEKTIDSFMKNNFKSEDGADLI